MLDLGKKYSGFQVPFYMQVWLAWEGVSVVRVGAAPKCVALAFGLRWPMLARGRCMLALLGSASGSSPPNSGPRGVPGTSGHEGWGGACKSSRNPGSRLYVDIYVYVNIYI